MIHHPLAHVRLPVRRDDEERVHPLHLAQVALGDLRVRPVRVCQPGPPDTVTLIANYIPLEDPAGGPNFFEFGDDVLYEIYIDNDGDGEADVTYQFRFTTRLQTRTRSSTTPARSPSLDDPNWNGRQTYDVTRVKHASGAPSRSASGLATPPCNIGPRSTPNYPALATRGRAQAADGEIKVFAGQRDDAFFVDLGSIFDLGDLRPFQNLHLIPLRPRRSVDPLAQLNVHTIAIQVPKAADTDGTGPTDPSNSLAPYSASGLVRAAGRPVTGITVPGQHHRHVDTEASDRTVDAGVAARRTR